MKLYKCRCMIIPEEELEIQEYKEGALKEKYCCDGCDAYFYPCNLFNYFMYYLGKPFGYEAWGLNEMLTWNDIEWWLVKIKVRIEEFFNK